MYSKQACIFALLLAVSPAFADAPKRSSDTTAACVDVQIGNDRTANLECLNNAFQQRVQREHGTPPVEAPIGTQSSSNQLGTFNESAAREHMGNAYGVSAVPQRPPKPVFVNPLLPPGAH